jgi:NAD(P)-dependent dehydrogenase (short-subunit alcohol dehydrogenase family)
MSHPAIQEGTIAVITGGAVGIGLAAAVAFAGAGLKVCIVDMGTASWRAWSGAVAERSTMRGRNDCQPDPRPARASESCGGSDARRNALGSGAGIGPAVLLLELPGLAAFGVPPPLSYCTT